MVRRRAVVAAYQQWLAVAPADLDANLTVLRPGPEPVVLITGSWLAGDPAGLAPRLDALAGAVGVAPLNRTVVDQSYRDAMMRTYG
ncbi:MAG: hypothetical protein LC635_00145 [Pseudonocardiaceae bacterium]|nr:hypothetical protein [Pseudonocardiaceae bacterium]